MRTKSVQVATRDTLLRRFCQLAAAGLAAVVIGSAMTAPAEAANTKEVDRVVLWPTGWEYLAYWQTKRVPAIACPSSHPFLLNQSFSPATKDIARGISIEQDNIYWSIDVAINQKNLSYRTIGGLNYVTGIEDSPFNSATNWTGDDVNTRYRAVLHCSNNASDGYMPGRN